MSDLDIFGSPTWAQQHIPGRDGSGPPPLPFPKDPDLWDWFINDLGVAFVCVRRHQPVINGGAYTSFPGVSAKWLKTNIHKADDISDKFLRAVLMEIVKLSPHHQLGTLEPWHTLSLRERERCASNCANQYQRATELYKMRAEATTQRVIDEAAGLMCGVVDPEAMLTPKPPALPHRDPLAIVRKVTV